MPDTGVTNWPLDTDDLNLPADMTISPLSAGDGHYTFKQWLERATGMLRATAHDLLTAMTHNLPMGGFKITGLGTPTASTDAATKAYVDATAQGLSVKPSVKGASTTNHSVSAFSGSTIDAGSVALVNGDRILLKDQTSASENGPWVFNGAGSALSRPTDFAHGAQEAGAFVFVESGTTNANRGYVLSGTSVLVDTDAETWVQFSGAGEITAGAGMTKSGDTLNVVANADGTMVVNADDLKVGTLIAGNIPAGLITSAMVADGALVNADINAAAAIVYSKLALTGTIVNADIAAAAAVAYSKLNLTGSIVNADINAAAAVAYSKLALTGSIVNADIANAAAIAYSKLNLAGSVVNADVNAAAAIAYSKLNLTGSIVDGDVAAANKDGVAGTASLRTLGTGAQQAAAGNDSRFPLSAMQVMRLTSDMAKGGGAGAGDTALANVTGMSFTIAVNEIWHFEIVVFYDASTTGDAQFAITTPTGATLLFGGYLADPAATTANTTANFNRIATSGSGLNAGGAGVGTKLFGRISGIVIADGTHPGTVQLQFAQRIADGTNASTLYTNTHGRAVRAA